MVEIEGYLHDLISVINSNDPNECKNEEGHSTIPVDPSTCQSGLNGATSIFSRLYLAERSGFHSTWIMRRLDFLQSFNASGWGILKKRENILVMTEL